jgi:hypothetical protein
MKKIKSIFFLTALFYITNSFAQDNMKYAQCGDCGLIAKVSNDASWRPTKQEYSCPKTGNTRACSFHKLYTKRQKLADLAKVSLPQTQVNF